MAAQLFYVPFAPLFTSRGLPAGAAKTYFYLSGTTTPAPVFADAAMTIPLANPVGASALGQLPPIYLDEAISYRVRSVDAAGVAIGNDFDPYVPGTEREGPTGPANNTRANLAALKAAATTDLTSLYDGSLWAWKVGNYAAMVSLDTAGGIFVPSTSNPSGSAGAWVRQFTGDVDVRWFGAKPDGVTNPFDSAPAIMLADAVARALLCTLVFIGIFRIKTTLVLGAATHWVAKGSHFLPGEINQGSYLLKDGSLNGPVVKVDVGAQGSKLYGITLIGDTGNGGDGFLIHGNTVCLYDCGAQGMGQDGLRVGDATGDPLANANSATISGFMARFNGRDGLHIDDQTTAPNVDANVLYIEKPLLANNERHGLYANRNYLGTVVVAPTVERNKGVGIYLDAACYHLKIVGGDAEQNNNEQAAFGDQLFAANMSANRVEDLVVQGLQFNSRLRSGPYVPAVIGGDTAGTATYSKANGHYFITGQLLTVIADLAWTGHTGSGQMRVSLPSFTLQTGSGVPEQMAAAVIGNLSAGAGNNIAAEVLGSGPYFRLFATTNGAIASALTVPAAGNVRITAQCVIQQYESY